MCHVARSYRALMVMAEISVSGSVVRSLQYLQRRVLLPIRGPWVGGGWVNLDRSHERLLSILIFHDQR